MSFWESNIGEITGSSDVAFAKSFTLIPSDTMAVAQIASFENKEYMGTKYLQIDWEIIDGEFTGQHVFQKLHVFDADTKKRFRFLNMLKLIYQLFHVKPSDANPPTDNFLRNFVGNKAGIKIQLTEPNTETGKQYNWVSEVHNAKGFECITGERKPLTSHVETAFSRQREQKEDVLDDGIPF